MAVAAWGLREPGKVKDIPDANRAAHRCAGADHQYTAGAGIFHLLRRLTLSYPPATTTPAGQGSGECGLTVKCIECGDELVSERAELGYRYCTKKQCQAKHHRGLTITAIGVNKSADTFIVGDQEEIRKRAEAGEFAKKDSGLGINYRSPQTGVEIPSRPSGSVSRKTSAQRPWTREQEKIVRLYNGMGLTPRQIVERARKNTPKLGITESLVTKIMCSPPG